MLKYYINKFLPIMQIINGSFTQSDLLKLILHLLDTFKNRCEVGIR